MEMEEFRERLGQAEMVLVGLGEEFDAASQLGGLQEFENGRSLLQAQRFHWLLPAWGEYCAKRSEKDFVRTALKKLCSLLEGENFFVVSVSTNSEIVSALGGSKRLVMPCGGVLSKQCAAGCGGEVSAVTAKDWDGMDHYFRKVWDDGQLPKELPSLGSCGQCGGSMVLNNIYADSYNENGYLEMWQRYTKWLQGTLNHRLFLLELGVSMGFPSVIRRPFEKIAAYNQKAFLYRINEKIYQLPKELLSKGSGISKNAIDWIGQL